MIDCDLKSTVTFTGADHLQHHLSSPTGVQPRLLVQDLLLFHLFFLAGHAGNRVSDKSNLCNDFTDVPFPSR